MLDRALLGSHTQFVCDTNGAEQTPNLRLKSLLKVIFIIFCVTLRNHPGEQGKACDVVISRNSLKVGLKGQPPKLDGKLSKSVQVDECTWLVDDGWVVINMDKVSVVSRT